MLHHSLSSTISSPSGSLDQLSSPYYTKSHLTEFYVIVMVIAFSKAFDRVRNFTLMEEMALLDLPDRVHYWLADFYNGYSYVMPGNNMLKYADDIY
jgi:hypothetical protein